MQPAIFAVIGQRLVARIDDGAIELHPLVDVVDDVIGALAQLKNDMWFRRRRLEVEGQRVGLSDSSGPGEDLPRREKSKKRPEHRRRELRLTFHQIILMTTERRAGVVVDIVLDEGDVLGASESG